jgi:hypothetical protein
MRSGLSRTGPAALLGLAWLSLLGPAARPSAAQIPLPEVPDITQRSGLFTRVRDFRYNLPYDPRRDTFYDNTRFVDNPTPHFPNKLAFRQGGMYGIPWRVKDSASVYPYFYGAPGESTITPESRPVSPAFRYVQGIIHPFKPVGMYFADGSYVPIYDPSPIVPGPGPFPFPWYFGGPPGG